MMKRRLIGLGVAALVLALLLALAPACGRGGEGTPVPGVTPTPGVKPTPTAQAKTLKIGLLTPLSGIAAQWGLEIEEGVMWAVDRYNAGGGFKVGADTYTIKIIKGDDKFLGSAAAEQITRMVYDEGIHYVTGPIATYEAIAPIALQAKCFVINMTNSELVRPENPYLIMGAAPVRTWYPTFWDQAYKYHPEIKTVAIISPEGPLADPHVAAERVGHEKNGREVVMVQRYTAYTADMYHNRQACRGSDTLREGRQTLY